MPHRRLRSTLALSERLLVVAAARAARLERAAAGLRTLGVQLFNGNATLLNELVRTTASPMCHRFFCSDHDKLTMTMALVQPAGDSGVRRLAGEAKWGFQRGGNEGDNYAIRQAGARSGGVIVDVGSNLGDVAIAAATLHPEALVVGVEANPITYFYMRWNLHLNGLAADSVFPRVRSNAARAKQRGAPPPVQRVVALHGAIGTSDMRMYAAPGNTLNAMAVPQRPAAAEAARVQARVAAFLQQWPGAVRTDVAAVNLPRLLRSTASLRCGCSRWTAKDASTECCRSGRRPASSRACGCCPPRRTRATRRQAPTRPRPWRSWTPRCSPAAAGGRRGRESPGSSNSTFLLRWPYKTP